MKICIDAGHYDKYNAGALAGYYEGNAMWELALLLKAELEKYDGVTVIPTRTDLNKDLALDLRGKVAADNKCDLFISLHSNAATADARGTEIYYSVHRPKSKEVSDALGAAIVDVMHPDLPITYYRGSKTRKYSAWQNKDYYGVIRAAVGDTGGEATAHALLIEHGFHTNIDECRWLMKKENIVRLAQAEARVIAKLFGLKFPTNESDTIRTLEKQVEEIGLELQIANVKIAGLEMKIEKIRQLVG